MLDVPCTVYRFVFISHCKKDADLSTSEVERLIHCALCSTKHRKRLRQDKSPLFGMETGVLVVVLSRARLKKRRLCNPGNYSQRSCITLLSPSKYITCALRRVHSRDQSRGLMSWSAGLWQMRWFLCFMSDLSWLCDYIVRDLFGPERKRIGERPTLYMCS